MLVVSFTSSSIRRVRFCLDQRRASISVPPNTAPASRRGAYGRLDLGRPRCPPRRRKKDAGAAGTVGRHQRRPWRDDHLHQRQGGMKGYPRSGVFVTACQAKAGFAQSMAGNSWDKASQVAQVPIDAQSDGRNRMALGSTVRPAHPSTTWPIPTASPKPTCNCIDSTVRPGRSRSRCAPWLENW